MELARLGHAWISGGRRLLPGDDPAILEHEHDASRIEQDRRIRERVAVDDEEVRARGPLSIVPRSSARPSAAAEPAVAARIASAAPRPASAIRTSSLALAPGGPLS